MPFQRVFARKDFLIRAHLTPVVVFAHLITCTVFHQPRGSAFKDRVIYASGQLSSHRLQPNSTLLIRHPSLGYLLIPALGRTALTNDRSHSSSTKLDLGLKPNQIRKIGAIVLENVVEEGLLLEGKVGIWVRKRRPSR